VQKLAAAVAAARPHPDETADDATRALWALRAEQMKARGYKRPTQAQMKELGFNSSSPDDGVYGVDQSSYISTAAFQCMRNNGYDFAISRVWCETCEVDSNGPATVANAWAAGMAHVDVYLFPSYGCGTSAADQVDGAIDAMGSVPFGTLWFDIETGGDLGPDQDHAWLQAAIQRAVQRIGGDRIGIYASKYEWGMVMGGYADVYSFPLWFPDYDGIPNFTGWSPFAGWDQPSIKQFAGTSSMCGASVDLSWY